MHYIKALKRVQFRLYLIILITLFNVKLRSVWWRLVSHHGPSHDRHPPANMEPSCSCALIRNSMSSEARGVKTSRNTWTASACHNVTHRQVSA